MTNPAAAPVKKILIARFDTPTGAQSGVERIKGAGARIGNAAVIYREDDGKVVFKETQDWGIGKSAAVGALAAIILPGIGAIVGAAAGALAAYLIDAGFPDALLKQLGTGLPEGASMLVVLVQDSDVEIAEQTISQAGGLVLGSGLEANLAAAMDKVRESGAGGLSGL
jgi:uncharacterized membrane protein